MNLEDLLNKSLLNEDLYNKFTPGYSSPEDDNSQMQKVDTRKTRLTLLQINKMRMMNDVRNFELKEKLKIVQQQYGPQPEGGEDIDF